MSDKSNPLDRLTRPGGRPISDDETIPVLTERLTLPSLDLDISLPKPPPPVSAPAPAPVPARPPVAAPAPSPPPPPPVPPPPPPPPPPTATAASSRPPAAPAIPTYASTPADLPMPSVPEVDWPRIEQTLRDTLLRELQPALADEAGRLLRERLQPAVERVLLAATAELRQAFEARLRETIARVVAAELARHRNRV